MIYEVKETKFMKQRQIKDKKGCEVERDNDLREKNNEMTELKRFKSEFRAEPIVIFEELGLNAKNRTHHSTLSRK